MKVEIISRETIKPSSPTPLHLRALKLSLLDQIIPPVYVPIVLFYNTKNNEGITGTAKRAEQLKKSLSDALNIYYPLAGRTKDGFTIDCNDEGVDFLEAQVNCELSEVLTEPELEVIKRFIPSDYPIIGPDNVVQLAVQVNHFNCGGLAIGMSLLHKIIDASSLTAFVNYWASIARGSTEAACPIFIQDSLFPSRDLSGFTPNIGASKLVSPSSIRTRRFVFDGSNIAALKAKVADNGYLGSVKQPSRVEVVSSLIWQRIIAASRAKPGSKKLVFMANHAINMRKKLVPPLPETSIGNLVWRMIVSSKNEGEIELGDLVVQLSEAIHEVDDGRLKELQGDDGALRIFEGMKKLDNFFSADEVDSYTFSSWCRFPLYEADFGWGKPTWVTDLILAAPGLSNVVMLMDTRLGDGIQAWVTLDEQVMATFENDKELLRFASSNPSALD